MLNIIIVFPKIQDADSIRGILLKSGYTNAFSCNSGTKALSLLDECSDGIVISGYKLIDMMYSDIKDCMPGGYRMLLMASESALSGERDDDLVCLSMPMKVRDLIDTIDMMEQGIMRLRMRKHEKSKERNEEQEALIKEAKALLIDRNHMSEEEAHHYIQKCSMDSGTNLVETAQMVLAVMR